MIERWPVGRGHADVLEPEDAVLVDQEGAGIGFFNLCRWFFYKIIRNELDLTMALCGHRDIKSVDRDILLLPPGFDNNR